jgi:HlyD family secretion protein
LSRSLPAPNPEAARLQLIRQFQSETAEIRAAPEPIQARLMLFVLAALLLSLVAISAVFPIDRVVTSQFGQVITTRPALVLQALDASIIKSIDVEEGQRVPAHAVLATLDPTFAAADVSALRLQVESLEAQIARADAELAHRPFVPPASADGQRNPYATLQEAYYEQRRQQFDAQVKADEEQIAQAKATIARLENDEARYKDRVAIAAQVEGMRSDLEAARVGSRLNVLGATDTRLEILRNLEADRNSLIETQHQLAAAVDNRDAFIQQWLGQASQELLTARNARDNALAQLAKADRHNDLVRLEAPEDAVVLNLAKLSVGSVLKEGDPLITLAPLNSPMQAEVFIGARDVGFIRPGDPVSIKFDAYQFVEHGTASGTVLWISEGTFNTDPSTGMNVDPLGRPVPPYYKARIGFTSVKLQNVPDSFRLIPGMTLTGDVHVGTRSLFMYMVRGVVRGMDEAMREP